MDILPTLICIVRRVTAISTLGPNLVTSLVSAVEKAAQHEVFFGNFFPRNYKDKGFVPQSLYEKIN